MTTTTTIMIIIIVLVSSFEPTQALGTISGLKIMILILQCITANTSDIWRHAAQGIPPTS